MVLERLRLVDGQVVGYEIRYLPRQIGEALTPDEIHNQPLVPAVRRILGKSRTRLSLRVTASTARGRRPGCSGTKVGAPVLVREHTWYFEPEGPMQYGKSIFRGDRYQMSVDFTSAPHGRRDSGRRRPTDSKVPTQDVAEGPFMKAMKFPEAGKAEIVEVPVPTPGLERSSSGCRPRGSAPATWRRSRGRTTFGGRR